MTQSIGKHWFVDFGEPIEIVLAWRGRDENLPARIRQILWRLGYKVLEIKDIQTGLTSYMHPSYRKMQIAKAFLVLKAKPCGLLLGNPLDNGSQEFGF